MYHFYNTYTIAVEFIEYYKFGYTAEDLEDRGLVVKRFFEFYGFDLLNKLNQSSFDVFINYETSVTPLYLLPFRKQYEERANELLTAFAEFLHARNYKLIRPKSEVNSNLK